MIRERIADDIYVFTSRLYAQVTAGAILTKEGAILIDTLYFPEETKAIKQFLEDRLNYPVRYVINTHYHADHSQGTYLFPRAQVIGHTLCRELLHTVGREGLERAKQDAPELSAVEIVLPDLVLEEGVLQLNLGGKTIELRHTPGHSPDLLSVYVTNNQVLFASDNLMPVPTIFDGSHDDLMRSLEGMLALEAEAIVQGHGEVVLRGEIEGVIHSDLSYLENIHTAVTHIVSNGNSVESLQKVDIESCGKSRTPLNGLVSDLHFANLHKLYTEMNGDR